MARRLLRGNLAVPEQHLFFSLSNTESAFLKNVNSGVKHGWLLGGSVEPIHATLSAMSEEFVLMKKDIRVFLCDFRTTMPASSSATSPEFMF